MSRLVFIAFFVAILLGNCLLAYQPHFENSFPLIGDEYVHIAFGEFILVEGKLPFINPYFLVTHTHRNLESGFHLLLAGIFAILPGESVLFYKYIVVAFSVANSILLYWLVWRLTKDNFAGLMAMFFFGTIKSSGGILSHQYAVPFTLGVTLLLLLFILFHYFLEKQSRTSAIFLLMAIAAATISYPPTLFFFLGVALVYLFSPGHMLHEVIGVTRTRYLWVLGILTSSMIFLFVLTLYILGVLDTTVFSSSWEVIQTRHSLIWFFGLIPSLLAVVGLLKIWLAKDPQPWIFIYWIFFALITLYGFHLFGGSILLPYPRLFVYYLIGVSILSGIGLASVFYLSRDLLTVKPLRGAVVAIMFSIGVTHYAMVWNRPLSHHPILTKELLHALTFLKSIPEENAVVIADSATSFAVYPVAHKRVVNLLGSNVGGGDVRAAHTFINGPCQDKLGVINKFNTIPQQPGVSYPPLYLLTDKEIACDFLKPIYEAGAHVYLVDTE